MHQIFQKLQNTQTALKESIGNKLTPRSRKIIKYSILIFLIVAFIPEIYIIPFFFTVIKPAGETEINQILENVQSINNPNKKVNAISDWEEQNFTNIYGIKPNLSLDFGVFLFSGTGRYPVYINTSNQQPVKIRAVVSPFTSDPYWITYYHSGACGELADLFNFVVNRSHLESRIVKTTGEDHAWVEIKINDTWMYFDPTLIEIFQRNPEYRNRWFSEPKNFESTWAWNVSRVFVSSTNEDRTTEYTPVINISVLITATKQINVYKYDNGKQKWIALISRDVTYSDNETVEIIQLGESNRYKIETTSVDGYLPIRRIQEQEFYINSTGNVSYSLNPEKNGKLDPNFTIIGCGILFIVVVIEIRWIWRMVRERKGNQKDV